MDKAFEAIASIVLANTKEEDIKYVFIYFKKVLFELLKVMFALTRWIRFNTSIDLDKPKKDSGCC